MSRQFCLSDMLALADAPSLGDYHSLSPAFFLFTDSSFFSSRAYLTLALLSTPVLYSHEIPSVYAIVLERLLRYIREDRLHDVTLDNYSRNGDREKGNKLM